jgi:LmbE family N-acetylglucosaminyl deacetylase
VEACHRWLSAADEDSSMADSSRSEACDVLAFGAHPDDLEVVMGGTAAKLARSGVSVLFVDLCDGEPARHAVRGVRQVQAEQATVLLGVRRTTPPLQGARFG